MYVKKKVEGFKNKYFVAVFLAACELEFFSCQKIVTLRIKTPFWTFSVFRRDRGENSNLQPNKPSQNVLFTYFFFFIRELIPPFLTTLSVHTHRIFSGPLFFTHLFSRHTIENLGRKKKKKER